jgi:quercetin dioxygenase-like cupin family protein
MMSPAKPDNSTDPIRSPEVTTARTMIFDLNLKSRSLSAEPHQVGHTADTIVKYPDLRIVLITMRAGAQLKEHRTAGSISVQTLSGHIALRTPDGIEDLPVGQLLTVAGDVPHSVDAIDDSTFLLTIAWREKTGIVT